jgi:hypothetical protein
MIMRQAHTTGQQTMAFSLNRWLKLILKHITVPFSVKCLCLLQLTVENHSFMIPDENCE